VYEYNVSIERVVDADTLDVDVDLGFHTHVHVALRLARIDAYEMTTAKGLVATAFASDLLSKCAAIRIQSTRQEKYGRWLAEVNLRMKSTDVTWLNLNDELVRKQHAVYKDYS